MKRKILFLLSIIFLITPIVMASDFSPPERTLSRVEDDGDILTDSEEEALREKLDRISEEQNIDVVIKTTYSLDGKSPRDYADDYFDYEGFGMGPGYDGIVFLLSMEYRDWAISTHGKAIDIFTDKGQEYIMDKILPYLSDGDYYEAFDKFANFSEDFIIQEKTGEAYDVGNMPKNKIPFITKILIFVISMVVGGFISFGIMKGLSSTHKTVKKQLYAGGYETGIVNFQNKNDIFRNRLVSKTKRPERNSTGGGSSTHTSSSGRSHGGSSGKF